MIVRLIVIDPRPRDKVSDMIVYQVPAHSRAHQLLVETFDTLGIEHATIAEPSKTGGRKKVSK